MPVADSGGHSYYLNRYGGSRSALPLATSGTQEILHSSFFTLHSSLNTPSVVNEGVGLGMTFIGRMILAPYLLPIVVGGEEGVGFGGRVMNLCETEAVGHRKEVTIEGGTANDKHLLIGTTGGNELVPRSKALAVRQLFLATGEHAVPTVRQCAFRQTLKGAAPHEDGVTSGELLEPFQVIRQPVNQFVLKANGTVLGHGSYHGYHRC